MQGHARCSAAYVSVRRHRHALTRAPFASSAVLLRAFAPHQSPMVGEHVGMGLVFTHSTLPDYLFLGYLPCRTSTQASATPTVPLALSFAHPRLPDPEALRAVHLADTCPRPYHPIRPPAAVDTPKVGLICPASGQTPCSLPRAMGFGSHGASKDARTAVSDTGISRDPAALLLCRRAYVSSCLLSIPGLSL